MIELRCAPPLTRSSQQIMVQHPSPDQRVRGSSPWRRTRFAWSQGFVTLATYSSWRSKHGKPSGNSPGDVSAWLDRRSALDITARSASRRRTVTGWPVAGWAASTAVTRKVEKHGRTRSAARQALQEELRNRCGERTELLRRDSRFRDAADIWQTDAETGQGCSPWLS
jgi:hypothetical protein